MPVTEILQLVDQLVFKQTGNHLNNLQKDVIQGIWQNKTYAEMAKEFGYDSENHIGNVSRELYKTLSAELGEDIKKYAFPGKWKDSNGADKEDGVLVVVTEQLEQKDIFYLAEVWRGFASNVEKIESNLPETVSTVPEIAAIPTPNNSTEEEVNTGKKYMVILIAIIVILIIVISILVIQSKMLKHPPTQTPPNQENSQYNQNSLL